MNNPMQHDRYYKTRMKTLKFKHMEKIDNDEQIYWRLDKIIFPEYFGHWSIKSKISIQWFYFSDVIEL